MRSRSYFFLILAIISFSCTQKNIMPQQPASALPAQETRKKITIEHVGGIEFSKSYSFVQSMTLSEKEIDKMMEEADKENPGNRDPENSVLKERFEKSGFVIGDELLLEKFKYSSKPDTSITGPAGMEIKIRIKKDSITGRNSKMIAYSGKDSTEIKITIYMRLEYALLDVIPGGNKELIILSEHYLANTYFYDFDVYEIKTLQ